LHVDLLHVALARCFFGLGLWAVRCKHRPPWCVVMVMVMEMEDIDMKMEGEGEGEGGR
jgi:hypothetical protein